MIFSLEWLTKPLLTAGFFTLAISYSLCGPLPSPVPGQLGAEPAASSPFRGSSQPAPRTRASVSATPTPTPSPLPAPTVTPPAPTATTLDRIEQKVEELERVIQEKR